MGKKDELPTGTSPATVRRTPRKKVLQDDTKRGEPLSPSIPSRSRVKVNEKILNSKPLSEDSINGVAVYSAAVADGKEATGAVRLSSTKAEEVDKSRTKRTIRKTQEEADLATDSSPRVRKKKKQDYEEESDQNLSEIPEKPKTPRKRKTQAEKEAEAMPLAARASGLRMFVGAHVSMAKGIENAVGNSLHIGGNAFALFLKSQRKWENPALKAENRDAFVKSCGENGYDPLSHILPHGSYLVNLAQGEKDRAKQAYDAFIDDLHRCEALGIKYYNFHPGAAGQSPLQEAIARLAAQLNRALAETNTVVPVLENMAGSGSVIGGRFTDLRDIISLIKPEFRSRIGVCLDSCHSFAAGYDLRTPESFQKVVQEFEDTVGIQYLKAWHLNDSKAPLGSNRDLHQNIGLGFLGLRAFHNIMNEPRFQNMPLILETPIDKPDPSDPKGKKVIEDKRIWAREIKLLESLIGMDPEGNEFKKLEKDLSDQGRAERVKMQKQFDDKVAKVRRKMERERAKGQRSLMDMMGKKNNTKRESTDSSELSECEQSSPD